MHDCVWVGVGPNNACFLHDEEYDPVPLWLEIDRWMRVYVGMERVNRQTMVCSSSTCQVSTHAILGWYKKCETIRFFAGCKVLIVPLPVLGSLKIHKKTRVEMRMCGLKLRRLPRFCY